MPDITVYAKTEEFSDFEKTQIDLQVEQEIMQEAINDMQEGKENDWGTAIYKDYLSWNFFHNEVQRDIRRKNDGFLNKELYLKYTKDRLETSFCM